MLIEIKVITYYLLLLFNKYLELLIININKMNKEKEGRTNGDNIGANKVETSVLTFFAASEESKYCFCSICCENYELKEKGK
jgi:hypothetical protein